MANEIVIDCGTTGLTLYALVINSVGKIWNGTTFETINSANWTTYDIAMTEASGTGIYTGTFPTAAAGSYAVSIRQQAGGTPAITDAAYSSGNIDWGGSSQITTIASSVVVSGATINVYKNTTVGFTITGLTDFTGWSKIWFTAKNELSDADTASIVQFVKSSPSSTADGLLYLNGSTATAANGSITVNSGTSITVALAAASAATLETGSLYYDVKALVSSSVNAISEGGRLVVYDTVTRSLT